MEAAQRDAQEAMAVQPNSRHLLRINDLGSKNYQGNSDGRVRVRLMPL
jgi:hypothetical protein